MRLSGISISRGHGLWGSRLPWCAQPRGGWPKDTLPEESSSKRKSWVVSSGWENVFPRKLPQPEGTPDIVI